MGAQVALVVLVSTTCIWHALCTSKICFPHLGMTLSVAFVLIYHLFLFSQDFLNIFPQFFASSSLKNSNCFLESYD